jgi:diacylglycerol kinase family enzyme
VTIEKGRPWGSAGPLAVDGVVAATDAEVRALVEQARQAGRPPAEVGLVGGDLCRTVGGRGDRARLATPDAVRLPVDVAAVTIDGESHWFVAHLVARRSWWRGRVVAVMNAQWIGRWDVAPRSHPNDGLLDLFDGSPSLDDRWKARRRLITGTHVPHPAIVQRRTDALELELDPPLDVYLDGVKVGRGRHLEIRVEPDALTCVV